VNSARRPEQADSADSHRQEQPDPSADFPATYARTQRFSIGVPRNISVVADGSKVLYLRSHDGQDPAMCLWQIDMESGKEDRLACPKLLTLAEPADVPPAERARRERARESATGIVSYSLNKAGDKACFTIAGVLYIIDLNNGDIDTPLVEAPVFDPRLSPDGSKVAYVSGSPASENGLRIIDLDDPESDRVLAHDPDPLTSYGRAEFIAAEEMQRQRGFWWSPTSDSLLVTRVNENVVNEWWVHDPAHPDKPPTSLRYPAAGTLNAVVDLFHVDLNGQRRSIGWSDNHSYEYLANVVWAEGHRPLVVRQTRDQRNVSIAELDLETLKLTERRHIQDDTWVELIPSSPTPTDFGLLTVEDLVPLHQPGVPDPHPGCRALLLDGKVLTDEGVNVRSIVGVADRYAVVSGWSTPSEIHLFTIDLGGRTGATTPNDASTPVALTDDAGVHNATMAATSVMPNEPGELLAIMAVTTTHPLSDGVEVAVQPLLRPEPEDGDGDHPVLGNPIVFVEDVSIRPPIRATPLFYQLGADRLESAIFWPTDYDGDRPLPVLLDPYGGPHAQRVLKTHNAHLVSQWFADQGFVVLVTDGRGTPGRGPRWERQVWGDLAGPVLEDQLAALDDAAVEFGLLDLDRVAVRGWSFGGYLAALAVLRRPDRFHAAIAGAPVTTWRLYDTHYTERYLGHPELYPQHYLDTDLTAAAAKLERPLLLIHGLVDDNVVAAHTLRMSTALLGAGVTHQVLPLSGVTHMTPQQAVAENLLRLQLDFLTTSLG
jgi:dipeptidyl-peptidase-4